MVAIFIINLFASIIKDAYDPKKLPRDLPQSMRDITKSVFISTYDALTKNELSPNNKIETAQKIADVILKNYSPIIRNKALDKYFHYYLSRYILQQHLLLFLNSASRANSMASEADDLSLAASDADNSNTAKDIILFFFARIMRAIKT